MAKLSIEDLPLAGKRVLVRVDFNVPLDDQGRIVDTTRIEESLPTLQYILDQGGIPILMSHLGRPKKAVQPDKLSLKPIADALAQLLKRPVTFVADCIGPLVEKAVSQLKLGDILLLENLRFHEAEEHPNVDPSFAKQLALFGDLYVNDAFGTSHRKHSSTYSLPSYFQGKAAAGYLLAKELNFLGRLLQNPPSPFYAIIGGAKISTKIGVIDSLLHRVDTLFIGGAMAYTFLKSQAINIGKSMVEEEWLSQAAILLKKYGKKIILPIDCVAAPTHGDRHIFAYADGGILAEYEGLDIGPQTIEKFKNHLKDGKTLLWNGPLGRYEEEPYDHGTVEIARFIATLHATTVIGGGDLIAAVRKADVSQITHISTGGGATLEFIKYGTLPAIDLLSNR